MTPVARMFDGTPLSRLAPSAFMQPSAVRSWDLAKPIDRESWSARGGEGLVTTPSGYALAARSRRRGSTVRFNAQVAIAAEEVDAILVAFEGKRSPALRLDWGTGDASCDRGDVRQPPTAAPEDEPAVVRFPLAGNPDWTGDIGRLCLVVLSNASPVELQRIALIQEHFDAGRADATHARFRGRLANETRPAFLGVNGAPKSWQVEVPPQSRLEFGVGATARGGGVIRVSAATTAGAEVLLESEIGPEADLEPGVWHARRLDLSQLSGQPVELRFETEVGDELDRGAVLWSEPTILGPGPSTTLPNLVVVSIDTLRPDHLSLYGYAKKTSPRIDRWAEGGTVFEQAITTAPWTLPAQLSLMTGLDALRHGVNHRAAIPTSLDLLAVRLRTLGYQTVAVTGGGYMHADLGFDRGFDRYRFWADRKASDGEVRSTVDGALQWVEELSDRPIFLFAHTYEVHHPYRLREPFFSRFFGEEAPAGSTLSYVSNGKRVRPETLLAKSPTIKIGPDGPLPLDPELLPMLVAAYDSGIAYADREIGRLLDRLDDPIVAARTATVLTSDHGEALGEKGFASHLYLEDFNARIPLVLRLPGGGASGRRIDRQVSLIDVYPTLLELAGETIDSEGVDGRSLLPLVESSRPDEESTAWTYASFSRRGLGMRLGNRWKYTLNNTASSELLGAEELYDLVTDPAEANDLAASHPRTPEFRRKALRHIAKNSGGLQLRLRNPSDEPLVFALSGPDLNLARTKAATPDPERLAWVDGRLLRVTVPVGAETILFVEGAESHRIRVRIEAGLEVLLDQALAAVELPLRVDLQAGELTPASRGASTSLVVLEVDWRGPRGGIAGAADRGEVQQQLEALGYLN